VIGWSIPLLFDAHIHLTDKEYSGYIKHIVTSLRAMEIVAFSVTMDLETTLRGFQFFNQAQDVIKQFVGIHPEAAAKEDVEKFKDAFQSNIGSIDGIGEIGLDGTYIERGISYERQKEVFNVMLQLAESAGKPVSIHSRKALDEILEILPSYRLKGVLLHWFTGSKKQLRISMDRGLYVSYGPTLVYSDDKKVLLKHTDIERFLVETDGPVRYSKCFENLPAISTSFLVSVISSSARVLDMTFEDAAKLLEKNSQKYLGNS
jgi:TatD DNase family protein